MHFVGRASDRPCPACRPRYTMRGNRCVVLLLGKWTYRRSGRIASGESDKSDNFLGSPPFCILARHFLPCSYFCKQRHSCFHLHFATGGLPTPQATSARCRPGHHSFFILLLCLIHPCINRESTLMRRKLSICPHYAIGDKASVHGIRCRGRVVPTGTCMC